MDIYVQASATSDKPHIGTIRIGARRARCALGRAGVRAHKQEGDGATPIGRFPLRRLWYRPDREARPISPHSICAITPQSGWSDDPDDPAYNTPICRPHPFHHERLWRRDHIYNLFFELGYNDAPAIANKGSAIFLHLAHPDMRATEGCIGVNRAMMIAIIARATPRTYIHIG